MQNGANSAQSGADLTLGRGVRSATLSHMRSGLRRVVS